MRSKSFLSSNTTTFLYREVNGKVRYYKIKTYLTLFGEYLLIREWGGIDNKNATGQKQSYFSSLSDLKNTLNKTVHLKSQRGYSQTLNQTIS
ncbi:WGR domain-containing protein [Sulfurimonas paralvinellae]